MVFTQKYKESFYLYLDKFNNIKYSSHKKNYYLNYLLTIFHEFNQNREIQETEILIKIISEYSSSH
jgi:hypothetical protein